MSKYLAQRDIEELITRIGEADSLIYSGKGVAAPIAIRLHADMLDVLKDLRERTCPDCGDIVPPGWTLDDHFSCNNPEDFAGKPDDAGRN